MEGEARPRLGSLDLGRDEGDAVSGNRQGSRLYGGFLRVGTSALAVESDNRKAPIGGTQAGGGDRREKSPRPKNPAQTHASKVSRSTARKTMDTREGGATSRGGGFHQGRQRPTPGIIRFRQAGLLSKELRRFCGIPSKYSQRRNLRHHAGPRDGERQLPGARLCR